MYQRWQHTLSDSREWVAWVGGDSQWWANFFFFDFPGIVCYFHDRR